jgi:hypothetical protein
MIGQGSYTGFIVKWMKLERPEYALQNNFPEADTKLIRNLIKPEKYAIVNH